jgi:uncharacterized protein (DUF1330 family)
MLATSDIDERYKTAFREAAAKHGGPYAIPPEEVHRLGERMRAEHVVAIHGRPDPVVLRSYSVPSYIIEDLCGEVPTVERKRSYRQRKEAVERWCSEQVGSTVTPNVIADVGEFSEATARTFINERPDLFSRVKRGHYLVRDPHADRQQ